MPRWTQSPRDKEETSKMNLAAKQVKTEVKPILIKTNLVVIKGRVQLTLEMAIKLLQLFWSVRVD